MDKGRSYLRNFKPAGDGGESWIVTLKGAGVKGDVDVAVATSGTLPPGYSLYVFDLDNECVVPVLGGTFAVNLANVGASRSLKVVMGTDAYVKAESGGTPLEQVFACEKVHGRSGAVQRHRPEGADTDRRRTEYGDLRCRMEREK
jgi:hypothetical protein